MKYKIEKLSKNLTSIAKTVVTCTDEKGIINLRFPQTQKLKLCSAFFCFPIGSLYAALNSTFLLTNYQSLVHSNRKCYLILKNSWKYHFRTAYLVAIFNFETIFSTFHENISSFRNFYTNFDNSQFVVFKFAKKISRGDCTKN